MAINKIELKIKKDIDGQNVSLNNMSLIATKSLIVFLESLSKIASLSPKSNEIKIQVIQGSAVVALEAPNDIFTKIEKDFNEVVENKSSNIELVKSWRDIQNVIRANGIEYSANIISGAKHHSVIDVFKSKKKFTVSRIRNEQEIQLRFIVGTLNEIGGVRPNFHIVTDKGEKIKIGCEKKDASRINKFLYKKIFISAWCKSEEFTFCDFYNNETTFSDFNFFYNNYYRHKDTVEGLTQIHNKFRSVIEKKEFIVAAKFLRLFLHPSVDNSTLKTVLVITKSFKEQENISTNRQKIKSLLESRLGTLV